MKLTDLPQRSAALEFLLAGSTKTPVFQNNRVAVTKEAAIALSSVFKSLTDNKRIGGRLDVDTARHYVLQCMLAMYAEDIGLLPEATFTRIIEDCEKGNGNSHDLIWLLFTAMNTPGVKRAGRFYGVDYFNGGIFQ